MPKPRSFTPALSELRNIGQNFNFCFPDRGLPSRSMAPPGNMLGMQTPKSTTHLHNHSLQLSKTPEDCLHCTQEPWGPPENDLWPGTHGSPPHCCMLVPLQARKQLTSTSTCHHKCNKSVLIKPMGRLQIRIQTEKKSGTNADWQWLPRDVGLWAVFTLTYFYHVWIFKF